MLQYTGRLSALQILTITERWRRQKIRDLSGALEDLNQSLQFNKSNIDARNLLGLVYYEMGEVVEALSQWVISKNLQPENNRADEYLTEVQGNKAEAENMNKATRTSIFPWIMRSTTAWISRLSSCAA